MNSTKNSRDSEGKYRHSHEKICECGHSNGAHAAERTKVDGVWYQECMAHDIGESEEYCGCQCFKKVKKGRK